jgi:hypothetical protein
MFNYDATSRLNMRVAFSSPRQSIHSQLGIAPSRRGGSRFRDGSVHLLAFQTSTKMVKSLLTPAGGETVNVPD